MRGGVSDQAGDDPRVMSPSLQPMSGYDYRLARMVRSSRSRSPAVSARLIAPVPPSTSMKDVASSVGVPGHHAPRTAAINLRTRREAPRSPSGRCPGVVVLNHHIPSPPTADDLAGLEEVVRVDRVVTRPRIDVVPLTGVDHVVAWAAVEGIGCRVEPPAGSDPGVVLQLVVSGPTSDDVGAAQAVDDVAAGSPDEAVIAVGPSDVVGLDPRVSSRMTGRGRRNARRRTPSGSEGFESVGVGSVSASDDQRADNAETGTRERQPADDSATRDHQRRLPRWPIMPCCSAPAPT